MKLEDDVSEAYFKLIPVEWIESFELSSERMLYARQEISELSILVIVSREFKLKEE